MSELVDTAVAPASSTSTDNHTLELHFDTDTTDPQRNPDNFDTSSQEFSDTQIVLTKFLLGKRNSPLPFSFFLEIFSDRKFDANSFAKLIREEYGQRNLKTFMEYVQSLSIVERMALYYYLERFFLDKRDDFNKVIATLRSIGCNFDFQTEIKNFDGGERDEIRSWLVYFIVKFIFVKLLELKSESLDDLEKRENALIKLAPYNSYVVKNFLRQWLINKLGPAIGINNIFLAKIVEFMQSECLQRGLVIEHVVIQEKIELILESLAYL